MLTVCATTSSGTGIAYTIHHTKHTHTQDTAITWDWLTGPRPWLQDTSDATPITRRHIRCNTDNKKTHQMQQPQPEDTSDATPTTRRHIRCNTDNQKTHQMQHRQPEDTSDATPTTRRHIRCNTDNQKTHQMQHRQPVQLKVKRGTFKIHILGRIVSLWCVKLLHFFFDTMRCKCRLHVLVWYKQC